MPKDIHYDTAVEHHDIPETAHTAATAHHSRGDLAAGLMKKALKAILFVLAVAVFHWSSLSAAPLFPACPAVGVNTGCQFLITVGSGGTTTIAMDPNVPNNTPYDGSDDTLVGVLDN